jgi:hypothetical protein
MSAYIDQIQKYFGCDGEIAHAKSVKWCIICEDKDQEIWKTYKILEKYGNVRKIMQPTNVAFDIWKLMQLTNVTVERKIIHFFANEREEGHCLIS